MLMPNGMGNDTSSSLHTAQAAASAPLPPPPPSSASSHSATSTQSPLSHQPPKKPKKSGGGGKGSWEFRFFALVSTRGRGEGGADGAEEGEGLQEVLHRAHGVTGVDLTERSRSARMHRLLRT